MPVRGGEHVIEPLGELAAERRPQRVDGRWIALRDRPAARRLERLERDRQCQGMALGDERREPTIETGEPGEIRGPGHANPIVDRDFSTMGSGLFMVFATRIGGDRKN